jgi:hypothetical protein
VDTAPRWRLRGCSCGLPRRLVRRREDTPRKRARRGAPHGGDIRALGRRDQGRPQEHRGDTLWQQHRPGGRPGPGRDASAHPCLAWGFPVQRSAPGRRPHQTPGPVRHKGPTPGSARALGAPVLPAPGLRERCFGALVGTSSAGFDWREDPPQGETLADFVARTARALSDILAEPDTPLLVAHGGTWLVLAGALGIPLVPALRDNAVPLLVRRGEAGWEAAPLPLASRR